MNDTKKLREEIIERMKQYWFYCGDWHNSECAFIQVDHGVCNCNYELNEKSIQDIVAGKLEEPTDKPEKLQRYVTVDLFAIATQIETLQDRVNWLLENHDRY